ncbi:MAG: potassium/proton antiporter [Prochlorococcaceae cyanobacterium]
MSINAVILAAALLLLLGIASSKFAARLGMPVLVLFLGVGMLAGSEGLGRIPFENYALANSLGSVALALILFDGGLRTPLDALALAWRPALSLSTVGVLLTSALTGLAASWVLELPLPQGLLLGSIVGSTDAAAVFSVLRTSGLKLPDRLTATLEVESGSNDPMAIFLTLALVGMIVGDTGSPTDLALLFLVQFGVGGLVGVGVGRLAAWAINRINLNYPGLYPLLALSFALLAFGLAAVLQGSGFLAVYLAGIVLGNSTIVFRAGIFLFHDAVAWLSQIALFVMLGLLSFPSRLLAVAEEGLLIALVLTVLGRPLAVAVSLLPFRFRPRELTLLSWVGLKGAVPITLATFPLMAGVPQSQIIFNAVFFVVLISAITQGWSLPVVARWLRLGRPADPTPALSVEINALRQVDGDIVDYTVQPQARVAGQQLCDLPLPNGVLVSLILRGRSLIMPRGSTALLPGDHVFMALRSRLQPLIDRLFEQQDSTPPPLPAGVAMVFRGASTVGELERFFAITLPAPPEDCLSTLLRDGSQRQLGDFRLERAQERDGVRLTCP